GQDDEGVGEAMGPPVHGDLVLLHRLEEGRLGLGRGPVDLVGQQNLGEDGTSAELERRRARVKHGDTGDIAGEQVGSELHPLEGAATGSRQRFGKHGLANPGYILDEHVPAAEEGEDAELDLLILANDHGSDTLHQPADEIANPSRHRYLLAIRPGRRSDRASIGTLLPPQEPGPGGAPRGGKTKKAPKTPFTL